MRSLSPTVLTGLVSGFLFFAHALIPYSHAWPLLWPLLGGVVAVFNAARRHRLKNFWVGIRKSAKVGSLAGIVFLLFTLPALYLLNQPFLSSAARFLGADGALVFNTSLLLSLAVVAALGIAIAVVAGAFIFPLLRYLHW